MAWVACFRAVLLQLAMLGQASATFSCPSEIDGFGDAASLLQQRAQPASTRFRSAEEAWIAKAADIAAGASGTKDEAGNANRRPAVKRAVAFGAGGFIAQADYIGLVAGLLRNFSSTQEDLGFGALFKNFDTLVGVSGGAWFASQLLYSKKFNDLIHASARAPQQTAMVFNSKYYTPALNPLTNTSLLATAEGLAKCLGQSLGFLEQSLGFLLSKKKPAPSGSDASTAPSPASEYSVYTDPHYLPWEIEVLFEVIILIQAGGVTWEDLVVQLFQRGAEIDPSTSLGSDATNAWAKNKLFVQGVSVVTPSPEAKTFGATESFNSVHIKDAAGGEHPRLSYTASVPRDANDFSATTFTPAKFSVIVGGGEAQASPLPFCATKDCFGYELTYESLGKQATAKVGLEGLFNTFEQHAGLQPLGSVAAAASAFKGKAALEAALGAKQGCVDLAVWAAPGAGGGEAFAAGRSFRDQLFTASALHGNVLAKAAEDGLQPFIDGANTDATGIGHALASGAEKILAILNIGEGTQGVGAFLDAFEGSDDPQKVLFSKPNRHNFTEMLHANKFTSVLALPNSRFLQRILFGRVKATTADNPWFGIEANRTIELGFIAVDTANLTLGLIEQGFSFNNFWDFGTVSGEIAQTLASPANEGTVQAMLREFFL